ncbi:helix-turn-helix domain-containing protein [Dokdonia sp. Hel_I_53]|uniref:helix-turn-helix domain-containing protein n=1 Tax=Dokdonia sp. Hel_I_53 TaxID=1566287 RepID=UPI00119BAF71|nr:helix-turn-helix transcriptional regulator [Dokdonia sp. Hel_I_53]TVZ52517.1 helix-turn-helix protein [Dokdonia sp. Hel_I_53]
MMKQPELGQKILELRTQKGLTQEELVEQCNISVRTIQRIEAGETTPRVYTIKTILSALDRDLDDLQQESIFEKKVKEVMFVEIDESKDVSFLFTQLHIGWIAGILSMIAFVFEAIDDWHYVIDETYYFGKTYTVILGIISIVLFSIYMRSFVLIGNLFKNAFLKMISILLIIINAVLACYGLIDLEFQLIPKEAYGVVYCIIIGLMYVFFGWGLFKLKGLGQLPQVSGIMHIVIGGMLLTILFAIVGGPASILVQGVNVAIILKVYEVLKNQITT